MIFIKNFILKYEAMKERDIVLVPFPFSDLFSLKTRPALIVSNHHLKSEDIILCAITSKNRREHEIEIDNKDLQKGTLPVCSYIKAEKIVTLKKFLIKKVVATITIKKYQEVLQTIHKYVDLNT